MKTFEITVDGNTETIKAKHIVGGNFLVCKRKTCNNAEVKYIETLFNDNGNHQYRIKSFYPTSPYYKRDVEQTVTMVEDDIDE